MYEAIELTSFAAGASKNVFKENAARAADGYFKNYSRTIDLLTAKALLEEYEANVPQEWMPDYFREAVAKAGSVDAFVDTLFNQSYFSSPENYAKLMALDSAGRAEALKTDPALQMAEAFTTYFKTQIDPTYRQLNAQINRLYRPYMRALMEMQPDKTFFPDANLTLRISYGQIEGYKPVDAVYYEPFSTLEGIIEKGQSGNLRLQRSASLTRDVCYEGLWPLGRQRDGSGGFHRHQPHHGRQLGKPGAQRPG